MLLHFQKARPGRTKQWTPLDSFLLPLFSKQKSAYFSPFTHAEKEEEEGEEEEGEPTAFLPSVVVVTKSFFSGQSYGRKNMVAVLLLCILGRRWQEALGLGQTCVKNKFFAGQITAAYMYF